MPVYETIVKQSIHALSVLLGREPEALALRFDNPGTIPAMSSVVISELPSELLLRRPDIRQAERQIAKANANVGVATAELYPRVNLTAFLGLQKYAHYRLHTHRQIVVCRIFIDLAHF